MWRLWLLEALREDSAVSRVGNCRWAAQGEGSKRGEVEPRYRRVKRDGRVSSYVSGLQTCGRITCPVCGHRIRMAEREAVQRLAAGHLAAGGVLYTSIMSLSHGPNDDPGRVLDALYAGRQRSIGSAAGGAWAKDRKRYGVAGVTWHLDPPPVGKNGLHWHLHLLWFADRELSADELVALQGRVHGRYLKGLSKHGKRAYAAFNGIEPVRCASEAAAYVVKTSAAISAEVAQGEGKQSAGRLPLDLLAEYRETGDMEPLAVFNAYERAMDGRTWRYKPAALTKRYGGDDTPAGADDPDAPEAVAAAGLADAADASDEVGGAVVLSPGGQGWRVIRSTAGAHRLVKRLLDEERDDEARAYVADLIGCEPGDLVPPPPEPPPPEGVVWSRVLRRPGYDAGLVGRVGRAVGGVLAAVWRGVVRQSRGLP